MLNLYVGEVIAMNLGDGRCLAGVALLVRMGALLGAPLRPVAVALHAECTPVSSAAVTSAALGSYRSNELIDRHRLEVDDVMDLSEPGWDGAGHLIALGKSDTLLLDPTLPQLNSYPLGTSFEPLAARTRHKLPQGFTAVVTSGSPAAYLTYLHVVRDETWREEFVGLLETSDEKARELLEHFQAARARGYVPQPPVLNAEIATSD